MTAPGEPRYQIAPLKLDFVIVGGGLAGFSAAYMLGRAGHRVRVLEKLPALGTPAAGLRVPPNMSKILKKWVGEEELVKTAVLNLATPWHDLNTGQIMGVAPWRRDVMAETGGDFYMMAHEDVHRLVHRLAVSVGAQVDFGVTVAEVTAGAPKPSVTLSNGEVITADIILGADGPRSMVREMILGVPDKPEPFGCTVFGAVISAADMATDPVLDQLVKAEEWPIFMGPDQSICAHPIRAHSEFSLMLHWPDEQVGTPDDAQESWYDIVPTSTINTEAMSSTAQRMMKMVPELYRTRHMERPSEIDYWIDETGRIVLIGEAAHPWMPGGTHGPAMALEDAVVLGTLFGHLSSGEQVPTFLYAYEELRQGRTAKVRYRDLSNALFVRLPPGPAQDERNTSIRIARSEWDDGLLKTEFEGLAELFGYDAEDAAEEWWITWGRYNAEGSQGMLSDVGFKYESQTVQLQEIPVQ